MMISPIIWWHLPQFNMSFHVFSFHAFRHTVQVRSILFIPSILKTSAINTQYQNICSLVSRRLIFKNIFVLCPPLCPLLLPHYHSLSLQNSSKYICRVSSTPRLCLPFSLLVMTGSLCSSMNNFFSLSNE